jgi:hypothetical protein
MPKHSFLLMLRFLLFFAGLFSATCHADTVVIDTRTLFEKLITSRPLISPNSSVSTPIAYGVGWGNVLLGVSGQNGTQFTHRPFGEYAIGFGVGDPNKFLSLTTIATMGGLDEVVRDGDVNFQLSRNFSSSPGTAFAVGVENVAPWGADKRNKMNVYAVGSKLFTKTFKNSFYLNFVTSFGIGNSRFVHNYEVHANEVDVFRPFASLGIQILPQAALMLDYVGLTYNLGISVVPFLSFPLVASLTATDITNRGGTHIPIAGSIGYSYIF